MANQPPIITLLTDFGIQDHYVAVMKGVILGIAPHARLIDITHDVESHNILAGAYILRHTISWFPPGTIHLVVVDPGVGSSRRIIAGRWSGAVIVAPDNGLVSLVQEASPSREIHEVANRDYFLPDISNTFHGRDIMAPVVAHLAAGRALSSVGPAVERPLTVHLPQPVHQGRRLRGQIIHIDRFGNLISNIPARLVREFAPTNIHIHDHALGPLSKTYADASKGMPLALIGSTKLLEISLSHGSARAALQADIGDEIVLHK